MAVYTLLGAEQLAEVVDSYDVGQLVSAKGIAEGVSNSNWLIETREPHGQRARFILTMYERRTDPNDLPFFVALLDHLARSGCAVPATIHDRDGNSLRQVNGKWVALIEFLPGISPSRPTVAQAGAVGAALARVHLAARDFTGHRADTLGPAANRDTLLRCGTAELAAIHPELARCAERAAQLVERWPADLPRSIIHSDLFPDNVLMLDDQVTGLIDFYFACDGMMAYDLAVTHAAWCFDATGQRFAPELGAALMTGYQAVRPLAGQERAALPLLAQGACLRFTASRAEDWLNTPAGAQVTRKDPMAFWKRWQFYDAAGAGAFASG